MLTSSKSKKTCKYHVCCEFLVTTCYEEHEMINSDATHVNQQVTVGHSWATMSHR